MANKKPDPSDDFVFVVNPTARIASFGYSIPREGRTVQYRQVLQRDASGQMTETHVPIDDLQMLEPKSILVLPGVNAISSADAVHVPDLAIAVRALDCRMERPWIDCPSYVAIPLASGTASRHALRLWREREDRSEVQAAIDERLARPRKTAMSSPDRVADTVEQEAQ